MKRNILLLLIVQMFTGNIIAQNNPTKLYFDIAKSISTARGNIDLYFTEGSWTKSVNSKKVIISFSENQKTNLKFSYSGGQIQEGSRISFSPGIHIYVKTPSGGLSIRLDTIWYDDNGKYKDWRVKYDNMGTNDLNFVSNIQDALRLNDKSENLFTAKIFKNFTDAKKSDRNGVPLQNTKPILSSIIIKKPNEAEAGLAVSFIPSSVLHFSSKSNVGTYDNVISMNTGNFEIRYLEYDVLNKKIDCEVSQFDVSLQSAILQTSDMLLNIGSGSKLKFNRIKIYHDDHENEIDGSNGTLNVQVASGTKISLNNGGRYKNELVLENGEMNLFDFGYSCADDSKTILKIGGSSTLKVSTRSGSFSLCDNKGYISLASGLLEAQLFGSWNSQNRNPDSHMLVSLLNVSLDGGYLPITNENIVGIKSGFLKSESLRFDSATFSSVVGEIKDLNVVLNDESKFVVPGGIQISMKEGSVISGAEPNNPLKLDTRNKYIAGLFKFNLNFSTLSNSSNELLKLHDGVAKFKIAVIENDTIRGRDIYFKGTTSITAENTKFDCGFTFSEGVLTSIKGSRPIFNSKVKFELYQGSPVDILTPYYEVDDRTKVYPLKLSLNLIDMVVSSESNVSFDGQSIYINELTIDPKFNLSVLQGKGQHKDPNDPNSANGNEGPDEFHTWQEAVFYDCPDPLGVRHFYLAPESYTIQSTMKLSITDRIVSFNFGSLLMNKSVRWEKDGCALSEWLGVFGAVFGTVFLGPAGTIAGGIVCVFAGNDIENNLKGLINAGIAKKITELDINKQWTFR